MKIKLKQGDAAIIFRENGNAETITTNTPGDEFVPMPDIRAAMCMTMMTDKDSFDFVEERMKRLTKEAIPGISLGDN
jgi:hypothetical protein